MEERSTKRYRYNLECSLSDTQNQPAVGTEVEIDNEILLDESEEVEDEEEHNEEEEEERDTR